jgi:chitodextrinase
LLARVKDDGINALSLRISALGRKRTAKRAFDSVRRFAAGEKLYLIAVLPAGKPHTPAARHAAAECSSHRFSRLRCAVRARSTATAAKFEHEHKAGHRLVAVYVKGPHRLSAHAGLRGGARRPTLVIAPLDRSFDEPAWGAAIAQTAASPSVDMGVAPKDSAALQQFAAMLAGEGGAAGAASGDTTPPSMPAGLATGSVTTSSVTLSWDASTDGVGVVGYRLFRDGEQVATSSSTSYSFTGLSCGTSYTLGVAAYDAAGNPSATATTSRSTGACADTQAPSTPTGLSISGLGSAAVTLSWNASADNVGVTKYRLFVDGTEVGSSLTTSYLFSGLSCQTAYTLGVAAADAAGNVSPLATKTAQTAACSDTQPPSTPSSLSTSSVTQTSMKLSWKASTDNVGVTGYRLFLNGSQAGTSTSASYSFAGLSCGTSYTLGVAAYDAAGNLSSTASMSHATNACPDTQSPTTPAGLGTSSATQTSLTLSWTASTDNVAVTGYQLFLNGSQVGTSTSTSYSFSGLTCATSYTLGVTAYDAAGNVSGTAAVSTSTAACVGGGQVVYLAPSGSDGSCARGDSSHPCATPSKAWSIAQPGDTIQVADGFYTTGCTLSGGKSSTVTFTGSANARFACLMVFPDGSANAVMNGISLYQVQDGSNTSNVTIENGAITCSDSAPYTLYAPDEFCSARIGLEGGSHWLVQNESIGPSYDSESPCGSNSPNISRLANVNDITFKNVVIHDVRYGCTSQHTENIRIDAAGTGTQNITFDGVTIYNGPQSGLHGQGGGPNSADLFMGGPGTLSGLVIQNSVIYGVGNKGIDGADDLQLQNSVIRNNSFALSMVFQCDTSHCPSGYPTSFKITNDIAPDQGCAIGSSLGSSGGYFDHNLWYYDGSGGSADKCVASDLSVNGPGIVNSIFGGFAGNDFTLPSGSPAVDAGSGVSGEYAPLDKLGNARPCRSAPDIGAYELCP